MGGSMCQTSRRLIIEALLRETRHLSNKELRQALFLKLYGDDYSKDERAKILKVVGRTDD